MSAFWLSARPTSLAIAPTFCRSWTGFFSRSVELGRDEILVVACGELERAATALQYSANLNDKLRASVRPKLISLSLVARVWCTTDSNKCGTTLATCC